MKAVAIVAPLFLDNTLRYVRALVELEDVQVALISQDPAERLPPELRGRLAAHYRIDNCLDGAQLAHAARALASHLGRLDGLLGVLEQLQIPLAEAREAAGIPGMSLEVAHNFRDKSRMKDVLRRAGLPCARHRRVTGADDVRAFIDEVGYPIILKPTDGLGSRSTFRIRDPEELAIGLRALDPSEARPLQAEEFIRGAEHTFETVTIRGQPVWHSGTRYYPSPLEVLENPWIQYCVLLPREADLPEFVAFRDTNTAALRALGMETGLSHMEWFVRADGSHVISEVGARPPGVMIMPLMSITHEIDMVKAWVRLMVHETFEPAQRKYAAGCAFFRGHGRGSRVRAVRGLAQAHEEVGHLVVDRQLPQIGQPAGTGYEGEGWAMVRGDTTEEVRHALLRLVTLVQVELG